MHSNAGLCLNLKIINHIKSIDRWTQKSPSGNKTDCDNCWLCIVHNASTMNGNGSVSGYKQVTSCDKLSSFSISLNASDEQNPNKSNRLAAIRFIYCANIFLISNRKHPKWRWQATNEKGKDNFNSYLILRWKNGIKDATFNWIAKRFIYNANISGGYNS